MKVITPFGIGRVKEITNKTYHEVHLDDNDIKIISTESIFPFSNFGVVRIIDLGIRNIWRSGYLFNLFFDPVSVLESRIIYKYEFLPLNEIVLILNLKTGHLKIISSKIENNIFFDVLDKIIILARIDKWEESKIFEENTQEDLFTSLIKNGIYGKIFLSLRERKILKLTIVSSEKRNRPLFYKEFKQKI